MVCFKSTHTNNKLQSTVVYLVSFSARIFKDFVGANISEYSDQSGEPPQMNIGFMYKGKRTLCQMPDFTVAQERKLI